jgi:hypothetical protein
MAPYAIVTLGGVEVEARLGDYRALKSVVSPSGSANVTLAAKGGVISPALDAFLAAAPGEKPFLPFTLETGYAEIGGRVVFTGHVNKATPKEGGLLVEIEALDDLALRRFQYKKSEFAATLPEIIEEIVVDSAIADHDIGVTSGVMEHAVQDGTSPLDLLSSLQSNREFEIPFTWYWTAFGKFVWRPWTPPAQDQVFTFQYRVNIVELVPDEENDTVASEVETKQAKSAAYEAWAAGEPQGPSYTLETIPHPWIQAGDLVRLADHPIAADGDYRVDEIEHLHQGGRTRSVLAIRRMAA